MKLKYILPILIGAFSFTSCNDFLDREPLDNVTPEAFFWSESDLAAYTIKSIVLRLMTVGIWAHGKMTTIPIIR